MPPEHAIQQCRGPASQQTQLRSARHSLHRRQPKQWTRMIAGFPGKACNNGITGAPTKIKEEHGHEQQC